MNHNLILGKPRRGKLERMKRDFFKLAAKEDMPNTPKLTAELDVLQAAIKLEIAKQKGQQ